MKNHQINRVNEVISLHKNRKETETRYCFGHQFVVDPNVFSPWIAPSGMLTRAVIGLLDFQGKRVLELGCGAGIFSCMAAIAGASAVVATDITQAAIENTRKNSALLGVENKIDIRQGSLFEPIDQNEKFDIIYADLPLVNKKPNDDLEAAFYSENLAVINGFSTDVHNYVSRNHEVFLCLASFEPTTTILENLRKRGLKDSHKILIIEKLTWVTLEMYCFA